MSDFSQLKAKVRAILLALGRKATEYEFRKQFFEVEGKSLNEVVHKFGFKSAADLLRDMPDVCEVSYSLYDQISITRVSQEKTAHMDHLTVSNPGNRQWPSNQHQQPYSRSSDQNFKRIYGERLRASLGLPAEDAASKLRATHRLDPVPNYRQPYRNVLQPSKKQGTSSSYRQVSNANQAQTPKSYDLVQSKLASGKVVYKKPGNAPRAIVKKSYAWDDIENDENSEPVASCSGSSAQSNAEAASPMPSSMKSPNMIRHELSAMRKKFSRQLPVLIEKNEQDTSDF